MMNELEDLIAAFESAQAREGQADLADFLPESGHPLYRTALAELIRIDLEFGWQRGRPKPLQDYLQEFPGLAKDSEFWPQIAFEEYRLRRQTGEKISPRDYGKRLGIEVDGWPDLLSNGGGRPVDTCVLSVESLEKAAHCFAAHQKNAGGDHLEAWYAPAGENAEHAELFRSLHRSEPATADRLARALVSMPEVGGDFLNFRLVGELGRGAFGRVFLAEQKDLAGRHVALKISTDLFCESQTLAQLQHTNIVPIYSAHSAEPFQALCMPYLGSTTLADLLKVFHRRNSLPVSGRELVSTLHERKHSTLPGAQPAADGEKGREGEGARGRRSEEQGALPQPSESPPASGSPPSTISASLGWKKLEDLSYVQAVLWIGSRLADGLAYAHEHHVIHRDLKPANVLLADDGQPLLLDFNLSENLRLRSSVLAASVGGTLPYMAPEHLESFYHPSRRVDARSDLYSLGLILYELVTGKPAWQFGGRKQESGAKSQESQVSMTPDSYPLTPVSCLQTPDPRLLHPIRGEEPRSPLWEILPGMIAERKKTPPSVRPWNKAVSPAVESIIRRCLEPDPNRRYQSARELQEDLERQLAHRPLRFAKDPSSRERMRKWARRHPRLTSSTSVAFLALALVGILTTTLVIRGNRLNRFQARDTLSQFQAEMRHAQSLLYGRIDDPAKLDQGIDQCRRALDQYQVLDNPEWERLPQVRNLDEPDRDQLRQEVGEMLFLAARAHLRKFETRNPKSEIGLNPTNSASTVHRSAGRPTGGEDLRLALDLSQSASRCYDSDKVPQAIWLQQAEVLRHQGRTGEADILFQKAEKTPTRTAQDCFLAAHFLVVQGNFRKALPLLEEAVQKDPRSFSAWFARGKCYGDLMQPRQAAASYSVCIALRPDFPWAWINRGKANLNGRNFSAAVADFDQAISLRGNSGGDLEASEAYLNRAQAQEGLKHYSEAIADFDKALELGTPRTQVYFFRATVREKAKDFEGARRDWERGLRLKPSDEQSWVARGLARMDKDPKGAIADFDEALQLNPQSFPALENKAHVLADLLKDDREAVQVLDAILAKYPDNPMARAGRGVSLARLGQRDKALVDAERALLIDTRPPNLYQVACIYALTSRQNPQDRLRAFELLGYGLKGGFGLDLVDGDTDLDPIRQTPEFRRIVASAREMHARNAESR